MRFEVLVEDRSGNTALDILIPKIIGDRHSFRVIPYRGTGRIPRNLATHTDASRRPLLDQLPRLLRGYGRTIALYSPNYRGAVILVCDLDDGCLKTFRQELFAALNGCHPKPEPRFCVAIEEVETWLLCDITAIKVTYAGAEVDVLNSYQNDSICHTWELLADEECNGGSSELKNKGRQAVGREKSSWSINIAPRIDVDNNASPSCHYFQGKLLELT